MRLRHEIYDSLLTFQADLSFDLESVFFRNCPSWRDARTVLDFGAGNAYYTCKLAARYPDKTFYCIERNEALLALGRERAARFGITFLASTYPEVPLEQQFDFILTRHTISYLHDRVEFFGWVAKHTSPRSGILIIDAIDRAFWVYPPMPHLERGNEEFKKQVNATGGERDLISTLPSEMARAGFRHHATERLTIHSDIDNRKHLMLMFMQAVAEYDHDSPIPPPVRAELDAWGMNSHSYLQYGLFGAAFEKDIIQ